MHGHPNTERVSWVDIAKGLCIILVVMMHSTLGVEAALGQEGWMGEIVSFAQPFRIPAFFLVSGLFLASRIDRDWASYIDSKVLHFAYFYALWVTIQFAFKAPGFASEYGMLSVLKLYAFAYVQPFGTLWFIFLLPIFFLFAKAVRDANPLIVLAFAASLQILPVNTGSVIIDEFCSRFVFFYAGYVFATHAFDLAKEVARRPEIAGIALLAWAFATFMLVQTSASNWPVVSLLLGFTGAAGLIAMSSLADGTLAGRVLSYIGSRSLVVYLAFFLPMAITRIALIKLGIVPEVGVLSLMVTVAAIIGPLVLDYIITRLGILKFLFNRPGWARLDSNGSDGQSIKRRPTRQEAEQIAVAMMANGKNASASPFKAENQGKPRPV